MKIFLIANLLLVFAGNLARLDLHLAVGDQVRGQQTARPSSLVRLIERDQERLREAFERDLGLGRAQPDEWEDRLEPLVKRVVGLTSEFRPKEWQGEELRALAAMYYFSEQHALAAGAYRRLLEEPAAAERADRDAEQRRLVRITEARFCLVRSLIELEQIDEAALALSELERTDTFAQALLTVRVFLHRDLAIAYRERLQLEKAARQAIAGFEIGNRIPARAGIADQTRETRDFETARLAAMSVALLERSGQQKGADELLRRWRQTGRGRPAQADATYEVELATQRMIGRPAPELEVKVWMDSAPLTSKALRGKVVLLHFWAMWNSTSTNQFELLNKWQVAYQDRGFQVVGVTRLFGRSDPQDGLSAEAELASLESFKRQRRIAFPFAVAGLDDVTNDERFNASALPLFILIDREGRIRRIEREASRYRKLGNEIDRLTAPR